MVGGNGRFLLFIQSIEVSNHPAIVSEMGIPVGGKRQHLSSKFVDSDSLDSIFISWLFERVEICLDFFW